MDVLVDANVVLRIVDKSSLQHPIAVKAVRDLGERHRLVIVPQVAYEFWLSRRGQSQPPDSE